MNLDHLRREYARERLDEASVAADPLVQFERWFSEAQQANLLDPNAMILATATAPGVSTRCAASMVTTVPPVTRSALAATLGVVRVVVCA